MSWNVFLLLFFAFTGSVDSKYLGIPNVIKDFEVANFEYSAYCRFKYCAKVKWRSYEYDTVSFKVEFVPVHDGESVFAFANGSIDEGMSYFGTPSTRNEFSTYVEGLKLNETYLVRVFAFNERGQSPPSPTVIFSLDPKYFTGKYRPIPSAPEIGRWDYEFKNGVKIEWGEIDYHEDMTSTMSPIEYTFRYGDNKNKSLWKELTTNDTSIILDDLKNGTVYSAYVIAKEKKSRSVRSNTFPIMVGEDMTGLPEAVITIEPADKNGVFAPGDSMTFKCSIPPNTVPLVGAVIRTGQLFMDSAMTISGYNSPVTLLTTAKKDVETAICIVIGDEEGARTTWISWKVKEETFDDEHLQKN